MQCIYSRYLCYDYIATFTSASSKKLSLKHHVNLISLQGECKCVCIVHRWSITQKIFTAATTTPLCHSSSNCTDGFPEFSASFEDCCNNPGNSFQLNSLAMCISCESRGESEVFTCRHKYAMCSEKEFVHIEPNNYT